MFWLVKNECISKWSKKGMKKREKRNSIIKELSHPLLYGFIHSLLAFATRFLPLDGLHSKKSSNVISSKSQVQAQVKKRNKVNSDNDHGKKLGSSGYIKMGGIIQGFGSPYDLSNRKQT